MLSLRIGSGRLMFCYTPNRIGLAFHIRVRRARRARPA